MSHSVRGRLFTGTHFPKATVADKAALPTFSSSTVVPGSDPELSQIL